jgi:ankyrin repeat protein
MATVKPLFIRCHWIVTAALVVGAAGDGADGRLLDAVRVSDTRAVSALLKSGVDPNGRDEIGATALMYAAALATPACLRILIDAGADVNATSRAGATALIWAAGDRSKILLLLDRGAHIDARSKDGTTTLVSAARRGNTEAMRMLLASGADPKASADEEVELLRIGYGQHPETREILSTVGIDLKDIAGRTSLASFPLSEPAAIGALLVGGANPNPRGRFPIVGVAAFQGRLETARLLVEHGASSNAKSPQDVTPLMMAAAAPSPDAAMVRLLMEKGVDLTARDKTGRSALDWALTQGDTEVARLLRSRGAAASGPRPSAATIDKPRTIRAAIQEALASLQSISFALYEHSKCISCHNQTLPLMARKRATHLGLAEEDALLSQVVQSILEVWNGRREDLMLGREVGGGANELTYGLLALAEAGTPPSAVTDAAVVNLASTQAADGSWVFLDTRPPQADNSRIPFTAMAIRGLEAYGRPGQREDVAGRIASAREFLRAAPPASTQDESFKLLGLVWSHVPATEVRIQRRRLLALQRNDGGWAQLPGMMPDAYATGQALYALQASGMTARDAANQNGVAYLLRTQLKDGTWLVRSRAFGFQPYFESGFPHGTDQFISASATSWAVIALASAVLK